MVQKRCLGTPVVLSSVGSDDGLTALVSVLEPPALFLGDSHVLIS